jgi:hypothetical protein
MRELGLESRLDWHRRRGLVVGYGRGRSSAVVIDDRGSCVRGGHIRGGFVIVIPARD